MRLLSVFLLFVVVVEMPSSFRKLRNNRKRFLRKWRRPPRKGDFELQKEKLDERLTKLMEISCRTGQQMEEISEGVACVQKEYLEVSNRLTNLERVVNESQGLKFGINVISESNTCRRNPWHRDVTNIDQRAHKKIRITGISSQICCSAEDVVTKIFASVQMSEFRSSVCRIQEFKAKENNGRVLILSIDRAHVSKTIVNKSRQKRGIPLSDLFGSTITGLVYINENLTRDVYQLYTEAKKIARGKGWKHVFTNNGVIFAKRGYNEKCIIIASAQDLCDIN